jgi:S1-C subfamily serine protease
VIGPNGDLIGVGSLQLQQAQGQGVLAHLNMSVPIDLLKPILKDMQTRGQADRPPRPWLGLYATEIEDKVVVVGLAKNGPAQRADLRTGDIILSVGGAQVKNLAGLFRKIWSLGQSGVEVPLLVYRDGKTVEVRAKSGDRNRFLKAPRLH